MGGLDAAAFLRGVKLWLIAHMNLAVLFKEGENDEEEEKRETQEYWDAD